MTDRAKGHQPPVAGGDPARSIYAGVNGWVIVAGLGPGSDAMVTPEVSQALDTATDVIGYAPYVARVADREGLVKHPSDNRVELDRARLAFELAGQGRRVVIVSSGDPGVFAMASALFEAMEAGPEAWREVAVQILPGITAALAAAAAAGAPLGHDFCMINLSDNLKPFDLVEKRLRLAIEADFAMAFYNPRSASRPGRFERVIETLRAGCAPERLVVLARAVSTPDETVQVVALCDLRPEMVDMRTMVLVGSSLTRRVGPYVYTPRSA